MQDLIGPLSTIAEYSIGLAGFTGIIAAISHFRESMRPLMQFRVINLLVTAFAPGFFSLMAMSMLYIGIAEDLSLRIVSGLMAIYLSCWAVWVIKKTPDGTHPVFRTLMWVPGLTNILMQGTATTLNLSNLDGYFLAGLVLLLLQGAITFCSLVMMVLIKDD